MFLGFKVDKLVSLDPFGFWQFKLLLPTVRSISMSGRAAGVVPPRPKRPDSRWHD
jgi:hypothetical protein